LCISKSVKIVFTFSAEHITNNKETDEMEGNIQNKINIQKTMKIKQIITHRRSEVTARRWRKEKETDRNGGIELVNK
jgi:hypothetical protein